MKRNKQWRLMGLAVFMLLAPAIAYADTSSSTNYKVDQTFFGSGGELNACSAGATGYCSKQTLGELAVGNTASTLFQAYAGFNTTDDPFLEFVVTASSTDLGYLSPTAAATANGQFYVRAWQAGGYVVRTESLAPTNTTGGHQLTTMAATGSSSPGTEQFGINLVKNTSFCGGGCDVGADPQQQPNSSFSFGQAGAGYNTSGQFTYNKDDIVASSPKGTSVTLYTVTYLFNISLSTPAGDYVFKHDLVATATY